MGMNKVYPKVGDKLYLVRKSGSYLKASGNAGARPYKVIKISKAAVVIQAARCVFEEPSYYCSVATKIEDNSEGEILMLYWYPTYKTWGTEEFDGVSVAVFTEEYKIGTKLELTY